MFKLDLKNKKILYQLDINSRQSNAEIAKKVGLSKQVVGLRIKRLIDEKVISGFYAIIDISKLGFAVHKNFLRLQNIDAKKEKELLNYLINHPDVVWIASCDGKFDLAFGTWATNMAYLEKTLTEVNMKFGEHIAEREIASIIKGDYFIRDYIIDKKEASAFRESSFGSIPAIIKMDKYDWGILFELGKNARSSAVEIAQQIKLSADAVGERIRKLEKYGVIRHYNIIPNEAEYPYLHYKILIGFRTISEPRKKALFEYCRMNKNIVYTVKALGPWDFEIDIEVESVEKFRKIMMEIKSEFSDVIKDYSALHIYQVHKYNFCPSVKC